MGRIEAEQRAKEAAASYAAIGQLPGEEDDLGTRIAWPRRDGQGRWVRVLKGGENGIGRHLPSCIRPGIVVQQRTLSRLDSVRKRAEIREVIALGQRLIAMLRHWTMSAAGRRAIEIEAERRRGEALVETAGQLRRKEVLDQRARKAEGVARTGAREVNKLRQKNDTLKESNAFDQEVTDALAEAEEEFKRRTASLRHARDRLARAEVSMVSAADAECARPHCRLCLVLLAVSANPHAHAHRRSIHSQPTSVIPPPPSRGLPR